MTLSTIFKHKLLTKYLDSLDVSPAERNRIGREIILFLYYLNQ